MKILKTFSLLFITILVIFACSEAGTSSTGGGGSSGGGSNGGGSDSTEEESTIEEVNNIGEESATEEEDEAINDDGNMISRLQGLEERLTRLSALMDWRIRENERREESYKDMLIQKLERLLSEERKRSDALLLKCTRMRSKLNSVTRKKE